MTVPQINPLPTPPQRNDPANFAARGDAFMAAMPTFVTQTNAAAESMNAALTTVAPVVNNLPVVLASPANAKIAQDSAATANTHRQSAATSATAAQAAQTAAQTAAATAQQIVWQGTTGYPKIRPSLLLDFAGSKTVDPRVTVTRNSEAGYFDERGIYRMAAANEPRIDHDPATGECKGILIEESRTNLFTYSSDFSHSSWGKVGAVVYPYFGESLTGKLNTSKLVESNLSESHRIEKVVSGLSAGDYTLSFVINPQGRQTVKLQVDGVINSVSSGVSVDFNIAMGLSQKSAESGNLAVKSFSQTNLKNGRVRISMTFSLAHYASITARVFLLQSMLGATSYQGDGVSGIEIDSAQLEEGSFPTSYVPTPATFTSRASVGTYTDSTGVLRTAAINEPRYDFELVDGICVPKGLLLERQATNLLTYSEQFDNAIWGPSKNVVQNSAIAPDGSTTADRFLDRSSSAGVVTHNVTQIVTALAEAVLLYSVFIKALPGSAQRYLRLQIGSTSGCRVLIDLLTMQVALAAEGFGSGALLKAGVKNVGSGWFRAYISGKIAPSEVNVPCGLFLQNQASFYAAPYLGDGVSGAYIWGAQAEEIPAGQPLEPTSYIKTEATAVTRSADLSTSSAVTRAAEVIAVKEGNFLPWYRQEEGTLFVKGIAASGTSEASQRLVMPFRDINNRYVIWRSAAKTIRVSYFALGSTAQYEADLGLAPDNSEIRVATAFAKNNFASCFNGGALAVRASGIVPNVKELGIGGPDSLFNGHLQQIAYYPKRLPNEQLQALTS